MIVGSPLFPCQNARVQAFNNGSTTANVGVQHSYTSIIDGLKKVYFGEGGFRGLYSGICSTVLRTGVGPAVQLAAVDNLQRDLGNKLHDWSHITSVVLVSPCPGFLVAI